MAKRNDNIDRKFYYLRKLPWLRKVNPNHEEHLRQHSIESQCLVWDFHEILETIFISQGIKVTLKQFAVEHKCGECADFLKVENKEK